MTNENKNTATLTRR